MSELAEVKEKTLDRIRQWMYYFIIGIVSFVALIFLPMLGTTVGLEWNIPDTTVGWIVWVAVKLIVAGLNVLIFHSFMQQAKLNIKDNVKYIEAKDILMKNEVKTYIPRSPSVWNRQQYSRKGVMIFITTALATIALTQALLTFDWVAMLSYLFTIIMGLIFGVLQMKSAEDYWTEEFWKYAKMQEEAFKNQIEEHMDTVVVDNSNSVGITITDNNRVCDNSDSVTESDILDTCNSNVLITPPQYNTNNIQGDYISDNN